MLAAQSFVSARVRELLRQACSSPPAVTSAAICRAARAVVADPDLLHLPELLARAPRIAELGVSPQLIKVYVRKEIICRFKAAGGSDSEHDVQVRLGQHADPLQHPVYAGMRVARELTLPRLCSSRRDGGLATDAPFSLSRAPAQS